MLDGDARVDDGVEDVDDEVGHHQGDRGDDSDPEDHRLK